MSNTPMRQYEVKFREINLIKIVQAPNMAKCFDLLTEYLDKDFTNLFWDEIEYVKEVPFYTTLGAKLMLREYE